MPFAEHEIQQLAATIWDATLGLPIEPVFNEENGAADATPTLCAAVQIRGAWDGELTLRCAASFAGRAAQIMFDLRPADINGVHRSDAVGELANMVGGNVKALLPETCRLSLPVVRESLPVVREQPSNAPGTPRIDPQPADATCVWLACDDGTRVRIELVGQLRDAA